MMSILIFSIQNSEDIRHVTFCVRHVTFSFLVYPPDFIVFHKIGLMGINNHAFCLKSCNNCFSYPAQFRRFKESVLAIVKSRIL